MIREFRPRVRRREGHVKGRRREVLFLGAALAAMSLFATADIWPNAVPNPVPVVDPTTTCADQSTDTSSADPSAVDPSAVDPSAVDPSAVHPSAIDPSTVDPSAGDSAVGDGLSGDES